MPVTIRKMTPEEFGAFYQYSMEDHARELMQENHLSHGEAVAEAKKELSEMLPGGLDTEHHYLMTIEEKRFNEAVGFLWTIHEETQGKKQSFLCDFVIDPAHRRKGYGTSALRAMEQQAAEAGCRESVLFAAEQNTAAIALYEKCGYCFLRQMEYGRYMIKTLA